MKHMIQRTWRIALLMALLTAVLTACGGNSVPENPLITDPNSVIQWQRDALAVVFRADVVGGTRSQTELNNHIPECTIYGDGRIVWTVSTNEVQVLFDYLPDSLVQEFVSWLTIDQRIFTYEEGYLLQLPQSVTPVYEQLVLEVNGRKHITDGFSGWEDGDYYRTIVNRCQSLAPTPRRFVPTGAWVSAVPADGSRQLPNVYWDGNSAGFGFFELANNGNRMWLEGNLVRVLWTYIIEDITDVQFVDSMGTYYVSLQVPGVTQDSPLAPAP